VQGCHVIKLARILIFTITFLSSFNALTSVVYSAEKIGVVLIHGKGGGLKWVSGLARKLSSQGIVVETPLLPWSRNRIYDRIYDASMLEIDGAVKKLKAKKATSIFIAGHSLGANAALGYGTRRTGLRGIIMLAAGHLPSGRVLTKKFAKSVAKAKKMVRNGNGKKVSQFADFNMGRRSTVKTTAEIYLSWFEPWGPASMMANAGKLKNVPVLWVAGNQDRLASQVFKGLV